MEKGIGFMWNSSKTQEQEQQQILKETKTREESCL
jgi:hypothetical protein